MTSLSERRQQRRRRDELQEPLLSPTESSPRIIDGLPWETSYLLKSLYFVEALGSATWGRFGTIYYNLHHLSSSQIGLLEGLMTMVPTICLPLWGILADKFHSRKAVYVLTKAISTLLLLTLAIPYIYHSYLRIVVMSLLTKLFVADGILDSYTLELLGPINKRLYGRYRLYASLSWGLGAIAMGYIVDSTGKFELNFVLYAILGFLCLGLVVWKIPDTQQQDTDEDSSRSNASSGAEEEEVRNDERETSDVEPTSQNVSSASLQADLNASETPTLVDTTTPVSDAEEHPPRLLDLVYLALRPRVTLFLLEVVGMGAGMATVERLLFLYMVNDLQSSTLLCGLSVGVNVIFELPIFWYATPIIHRLGLDGMQLLSMFCFVVRVYGYTLLTPSTRYYILPLEILHGITFACFWVVSTDVSKSLIQETNQHWKTTIPCSVQMLYAAVGVGFGSVFGGWAMQEWGSRSMYRCMASFIGVMFILHLLGSILVRTCGGSSKSFLPDYNDREENETVETTSGEEGVRDELGTLQEEEFAALLVEQDHEQGLL